MQLTQSFVSLLQEFRCVFTNPTYVTFVALMTGWVYSFRHRYVTELIQASDCTRKGHHSRYHRFFSAAVWCLDTLSSVLARLLVKTFAAIFFPDTTALTCASSLPVYASIATRTSVTRSGSGRTPSRRMTRHRNAASHAWCRARFRPSRVPSS